MNRTAGTEQMIRLEGIWKSYDTVTALSDLNLEVGKGRTLGIIGPNGSGKTTLLKIIATLSKPDHGRVTIGGVDAIENPWKIRSILGFMPGEVNLPLNMRIGEYMHYFASAKGIPRALRPNTVNEALQLTDMAGREEEVVRSLSQGNKQRLLLAKTLLGDPELLVLDEPASGLDPRARIEIRDFIRQLSSMGRTILISSHILADVESIASDICILEKGVIKRFGSMEDLQAGAVRAQKIVHVRVPEPDLERARTLLHEHPDVLEAVIEDKVIRVVSSQTALNSLLKALLDANVEIHEIRQHQVNLEDIFIQSTEGLVT